MSERFTAGRDDLWSHFEEILVVCPSCGGCARTHAGNAFSRRLSCAHCGRVVEQRPGPIALGGEAALDPHFALPLWLQVSCCGRTLWAYNRAHLEFLEELVGARLRERRRDPQLGWSNASLASRLPKWLKAAKHREAVLAGLATLAAKLPER